MKILQAQSSRQPEQNQRAAATAERRHVDPAARPFDASPRQLAQRQALAQLQATAQARVGGETSPHGIGASMSRHGPPPSASAAGHAPPIQMARTPKGRINGQQYFYDDTDGHYYNERNERVDAPPTEYEVGAGDFSAAAARHRADGSVLRKVTTFESEPEVMARKGAAENIASLTAGGAQVQYDVDATRFGATSGTPEKTPMSPRPVDTLRFDHPHTGLGSGRIREDIFHRERGLAGTPRDPRARMGDPAYKRFVDSNGGLVSGFFGAAKGKSSDKVILTYNRGDGDHPKLPYSDWNVEQRADDAGLTYLSRQPFVPPAGYEHVRTNNPMARSASNAGSQELTFTTRRAAAHAPTLAAVSPGSSGSSSRAPRAEAGVVGRGGDGFPNPLSASRMGAADRRRPSPPGRYDADHRRDRPHHGSSAPGGESVSSSSSGSAPRGSGYDRGRTSSGRRDRSPDYRRDRRPDDRRDRSPERRRADSSSFPHASSSSSGGGRSPRAPGYHGSSYHHGHPYSRGRDRDRDRYRDPPRSRSRSPGRDRDHRDSSDHRHRRSRSRDRRRSRSPD